MEGIDRIRKNYTRDNLDHSFKEKEPISIFKKWLSEALKEKVNEPNAMILSTATKEGAPSSRVVLLKYLSDSHLVFFSNYESRKAIEIGNNPHASLLFFWPDLERQVRMEGIIEKTDTKTSDLYFRSRPRDSQIGAWASPQSFPIDSRKIIEEKFDLYKEQFRGCKIPRPGQWGGYQFTPSVIEFWQGRVNRLHDRIVFTMANNRWQMSRLAP